jgi:hypothetical protein
VDADQAAELDRGRVRGRAERGRSALVPRRPGESKVHAVQRKTVDNPRAVSEQSAEEVRLQIAARPHSQSARAAIPGEHGGYLLSESRLVANRVVTALTFRDVAL